MLKSLHFSSLWFAVLLTGCVYSGPFALYESETTGLSYKSGDPPPTTKVFLVAGGKEWPSFSNKILRQKQHWLSVGIRPDEIACYYVIPDKRSFDLNESQFRKMASELSQCHLASTKILMNHLEKAAAAKPDSLYLFITSHGVDNAGSGKIKDGCRPLYDSFLYLEATPTGSANFDMFKMTSVSLKKTRKTIS